MQLSFVFKCGERGVNSAFEAYILRTLMSERIITLLVEFITHVIDAGGYAGIAALMGLNSSGIPIPSESITERRTPPWVTAPPGLRQPARG